jgi:hypothetical protein
MKETIPMHTFAVHEASRVPRKADFSAWALALASASALGARE